MGALDLEVTVNAEAFKVISVFDGCIDKRGSNVAEYVRTRDLKHIRIVESEEEKPWWFFLRAIDDQLAKRLKRKSLDDVELLFEEAFRLALDGVQNLTYKDGATGKRRPLIPRWHDQTGLPRRLTDETVERIPPPIRVELGLVALQRCLLSDDIEKNSSAHTPSTSSKEQA